MIKYDFWVGSTHHFNRTNLPDRNAKCISNNITTLPQNASVLAALGETTEVVFTFAPLHDAKLINSSSIEG